MAEIVRDPETGEFRSVEESRELNRTDRPPLPSWGQSRVQHVGLGVTQEMDDDELLAVQDLEPVLGGRMDSNEIAELIALDVEASLIYLTDEGSAADPTGVVGAVSLGLNMSTEEDPYWDQNWQSNVAGVQPFGRDAGDFDPIPDQTGSGDSQEQGADQEGKSTVGRPGFLHGRLLAPTSSWEDATSGAGGAGDPVATEYDEMTYRDRFRMGPIVDQSDELTFRLGIGGGEGVTGQYRIQCRASMYWQTAQVPGGRPDFSLPNL